MTLHITLLVPSQVGLYIVTIQSHIAPLHMKPHVVLITELPQTSDVVNVPCNMGPCT